MIRLSQFPAFKSLDKGVFLATGLQHLELFFKLKYLAVNVRLLGEGEKTYHAAMEPDEPRACSP
jgi:hypothetical protein